MKMNKVKLRDIIQFNPPETIKKGNKAKKIPMENLLPHTKKISGFENAVYSAGPKFKNNDTLLAKITPCLENGKTAFVDILDENEVAFGSSEFIVLRAIKNISDANYIYYLARSPKFRNRAISCMEGTSGRKRVNDKSLQNETFVIPSIKIQINIANVLSSLDNKIDNNTKINKELVNMAKTIYEYWFVQNADKKWKKKKIGDLLVKYKDNSLYIDTKNIYKTGKYPVITQDVGELIKGYTNEENPIIDLPTIIFGDHSCTLRYLNFPFFRGADGTQLLYFENEETTVYVYFCLEKMIPFITNFGKYERHFKYLKDFEIIIPSNPILLKFNKIVSPIFSEITSNQQENVYLAQLRDFLLPLLMNGQVKVNIRK